MIRKNHKWGCPPFLKENLPTYLSLQIFHSIATGPIQTKWGFGLAMSSIVRAMSCHISEQQISLKSGLNQWILIDRLIFHYNFIHIFLDRNGSVFLIATKVVTFLLGIAHNFSLFKWNSLSAGINVRGWSPLNWKIWNFLSRKIWKPMGSVLRMVNTIIHGFIISNFSMNSVQSTQKSKI